MSCISKTWWARLDASIGNEVVTHHDVGILVIIDVVPKYYCLDPISLRHVKTIILGFFKIDS